MAAVPIMEGYLYKNKKCKTTGWNKRWFILRQIGPDRSVLEYARAKQKSISGKIELDQLENIVECPPVTIKDNFRHVFSVKTTKQQYFLVSSSADEMHRWINCLSRVCSLSRENGGENDPRTLPDGLDHRGSVSTVDSLPSGRSSFSLHSHTMSRSDRDSPSRTGTLPSEHRSLTRPPALVLTCSSNLSTSTQKFHMKGDNPYIFLAECFSMAIPSRPSSQNSQFSDTRTLTQASFDSEPTIPEERAPPPPDNDNIYKSPPNCVVYDSRDCPLTQRKRWSDEKSDHSVVTTSSTYDTPARGSLARVSDAVTLVHPPAANGTERNNSIAFSGETYDRVPPLVRNAVRLPIPSTATAARGNVRKQSLPSISDVGGASHGSVYDLVPKPRTADNSPSVARHHDTVKVMPTAESDAAALYDRPPARKLDGRDSVSSQSSHRPSLPGTNLLSPREAGGLATPPTVDRNAKPTQGSGSDSVSMDRSPRLGLTSPHSSVGSMSSIASAATPAPVSPPPASAFAYPRQNSLTAAVPMQKVRRSTSQEDLAGKLDNGSSKSEFRPRGTNGTRTLGRQPKHRMMASGDIQYTDVQVITSALKQPDNHHKTLPARVPATPRFVEPLRTQVSIKSQVSHSGHSSSTDYKLIDPLKTKALLKTKESEEGEKDKRKN